MELMSFNVDMKQVEPVIKSVLHNLANLEIVELPKLSTLVARNEDTSLPAVG